MTGPVDTLGVYLARRPVPARTLVPLPEQLGGPLTTAQVAALIRHVAGWHQDQPDDPGLCACGERAATCRFRAAAARVSGGGR